MAFLSFFARIVTLVVVAYWISSGKKFTVRGIAAFVLGVLGVFAFYAGFEQAATEDARMRHGVVVTGVVVEKLSSTEQDGTRYIGTSGGRNQIVRRPIVTISGFRTNDVLARWIATGSPLAWVVVYTVPCDTSRHCEARDFVDREHWTRLQAGDPVRVRRVDSEDATARLDDNPQWKIAFANLGLAAVLLCAAGLVSGRLVLFPARPWLTAPAVVTAVEPVPYKDATHWRVRFAYFDRDGRPQEGADDVVTAVGRRATTALPSTGATSPAWRRCRRETPRLRPSNLVRPTTVRGVESPGCYRPDGSLSSVAADSRRLVPPPPKCGL